MLIKYLTQSSRDFNMAAIIGKYARAWISNEFTVVMTGGCTAVGGMLGLWRSLCVLDEVANYEYHNGVERRSIGAFFVIGTFTRYPIQYGLMGGIVGVTYPISCLAPAAYNVYYMYKHHKMLL
jgi:hypothetical protein